MCQNTFHFDSEYYLQTQCVAILNPLSYFASNKFIDEFGEQQYDYFPHVLNFVYGSIRFTVEL